MKKIFTMALGLGIAAGAYAQTKKQPMFKGAETKYGEAGCGLGSMVVGSEPGIKQVVAATLNGTGIQTFALTTGTSNCEDSKLFAKADKFIETNREALVRDAARGNGETIAALAEIYGCQASELGQKLQSNHNSFFGDSKASAVQVDEAIRSNLHSDKAISCSKIS